MAKSKNFSDFKAAFQSENYGDQREVSNSYVLDNLKALSRLVGNKDVIIQDTETTGLNASDEIYEFGAIHYQASTGRAFYVHKYVTVDQSMDDVLDRIDRTETDPEKRQALKMGITNYQALGKNSIMSKDDFIRMLKGWENVPQFAFNALFDISKESQLKWESKELAKVKYNEVYDIMLMAADLLPNVIPSYLNINNRNLGAATLEKFYTHLFHTLTETEKKKFGFYWNPSKGETHRALEDVVYYTVPVLAYLVDRINKDLSKEGIKEKLSMKNYKNLYGYWAANKKGAKTASSLGGKGVILTSGNFKNYIEGFIGKSGGNVGRFSLKKNHLSESVDTFLKDSTFTDAKINKRISQMSVGKNSEQIRYLKKAFSSTLHNGSLNSKTLIKELDKSLKSNNFIRHVGYEYKKDGLGGVITVYIVPDDPAFLSKVKNDKSKLPNFRISLSNADGIFNYYGLKGIDQIKSDVINGKSVLYTSEQGQLLAILNYIKDGRLNQMLRSGRYTQLGKAISSEVRESLSKTALGGPYVGHDDEYIRARSGTGTNSQLAIRRSIIDLNGLLKKFITPDYGLVENYIKDLGRGRGGTRNETTASGQVVKDLMEISLILGSLPEKEAHAKIERNKYYAYLRKSPKWNEIYSRIKDIASIGFSAGLGGENSFAQLLATTIDVDQLATYGGWYRRDQRKSVQVTNLREFSSTSKQYRKSGTVMNKIFTPRQLVENIADQESQSLFGYSYVTQKDIDKAYQDVKKEFKGELKKQNPSMSDREIESEFIKIYGTGFKGAHSGGSIYALNTDFDNRGLDSVDRKTPRVSRKEIDEMIEKMGGRELSKLTPGTDAYYDAYDEFRELAIRKKFNIDKRIPFEITEENEHTYRIFYVVPHHMTSGSKLLTVVDEDRTTAQGIHKDVFNKILQNKGLSSQVVLLKEMPVKFKSGQLGGLVGGFINGLLVKTIQDSKRTPKKDILENFVSTLNEETILKGIFKYDDETHKIVVNPNRMRQADLEKVMDALNRIGLKTKYITEDAFIKKTVTNSQGVSETSYSLSPKYVGFSQMGQADVYRYGEPIGKVVSVDYRFREAVERSIGSAQATTQKDLSTIKQVLSKSLSVSSSNKKMYDAIVKETNNILAQTKESAKVGYKKSKYTVSVGYGSNYDVDLNQDYDDLTDAYVDGKVDYYRYQDSVYAAIERAIKQKATSLGVSEDKILAYLDLGKTVAYTEGKSNFSAQHVYLPNFNRLRRAEDEDKRAGYDMPAYIRSFNSLMRSARYQNSSDLGRKAFEFGVSVYNTTFNKNSSVYRLGNATRVRHSMMGVANANNPLMSRSKNVVEKNIGVGDVLANPQDLKMMIEQIDLGPGENRDLKVVEQKVKDHCKILIEQSGELFTGVSDWQKIFAEFVAADVSKSLKGKTKDFAIEVSKKMNRVGSLDLKEATMLKNLLSTFIAQSVTLGAKLYNARLDKTRGIEALFARFPLSNGRDVKATQVFGDASVNKNQLIVGLGLSEAVNLDYDGDYPPIFLPLLNAGALGKNKKKRLEARQQFQELIKNERHSTSMVALTELYNLGAAAKNEGTISKKALDEMNNFQVQIQAALAGKEFKGMTGSLSNTYQAITQAMQYMELDEKKLNKNSSVSDKEKAIYSILTRAFFEKLTQDAISSKKVFDRFSKKHPDLDGEELGFEFLKQLEILLETIKNSDTWKTNQGVQRIFDMAKSMEIIDFNVDRITAQVLAYSQDLIDETKVVDGRNVEKDLFQRIFGVPYDNVKFQYDEQGNISSIGGTDVTGQDFEKISTTLFSKGIKGFTLDENILQKAVQATNANVKQELIRSGLFSSMEKNTGLGAIVNNPNYKPGTTTGHMGTIGETTKEFYRKYGAAARQAIDAAEKAYKKHDEVKVVRSGKNSFVVVTLENFFKNNGNNMEIASVEVITREGHRLDFKHSDKYSADIIDAFNQFSDNNKFSVTQIAGALHSFSGSENTYALEFGTLHHAIVEAFLKGEFGGRDKNGNYIYPKEDQIRQWILQKWNGKAEDKLLVRCVFDADDSISENALNQLFGTVTNFISQASQSGMLDSNNILSETSMGIVVNVGKEKYLIGGTMDQLWTLKHQIDGVEKEVDVIGDAKTSAYPYINYVIQLSLYNAIRRAFLTSRGSDKEVSKKMFMFLTPRPSTGIAKGDLVNVESLSDKELATFIGEALTVLKEQNPDARKAEMINLAMKWNPILQEKVLNSGGVSVSSLLQNKDKEFSASFSSVEQGLRELYKNSKSALGYEDWLSQEVKHGRIKEEQYKEHMSFLMTRAEYLRRWIDNLPITERSSIEANILSLGENNQYSIGYAYYLAKTGHIDFNSDLEEWTRNHQREITESNMSTAGGDDDMDNAKLNQVVSIVESLASALRGLQGNNVHGTAPTGGSGGGTIRTQADLEKEAATWKDIVSNYERIVLLEQKATKETGKVQEATVNKVKIMKKEYFGDENINLEGLNTLAPEKLAEAIENLGGRFGDFRAHQLDIGMTNAGFNEAFKRQIGNSWDMTLTHSKEKTALDLEKEQEKILQKQIKEYREILELQNKIKQAKRDGRKEDEDDLSVLLEQKKNGFDISSLSEEGRIAAERASDLSARKEAAASLKRKSREYRSLIRSRAGLYSQLYSNEEASRLTYRKAERMALSAQRDELMEQLGLADEGISEFLYQNRGDKSFLKSVPGIDEEGRQKFALEKTRTDVSNKGNHTLWGQLAGQMEYTFVRFTQMGAAYKILGSVRRGIQEVVSAAKELDKTMTNLRIVTGANSDEAKQLINNYADLGDKLGSTTTEVANSANEWLNKCRGHSIINPFN